MALTISTMRQILAAALVVTEDDLQPMITGLQVASPLPESDDLPLGTIDLVNLVLALIAHVPPASVAAKALRIMGFRAAGSLDRHEAPGYAAACWDVRPEPGETVGTMLWHAINRSRSNAAIAGSGQPLGIRFRRTPQGDVLVLETRGDDAVEAIFALPPEQPQRSVGALGGMIETTLPWSLAQHLAEQLGGLMPDHEADNDISAPIEREPVTARPN